ncbi:hypothetical protein [Thiohalorhabdus methylotrophus]|uniref:DUF1634 domain-containing protein n=1 Tax=Thiohalorhabdus methylotrophus TaxID=3242694 RepID=A0ABV4TVL9_9GAMM
MPHEQQDNAPHPEIPLSGILYGDIIYWGTIVSAIITLVGQVVSFVTQANHIPPSVMLSRIWEGQKVQAIWEDTVGTQPAGQHWYFDVLHTGDGLTQLGIAVGVFIVIPAILVSALVMFTKEKRPFFGTLATIAALITLASFLGILELPVG